MKNPLGHFEPQFDEFMAALCLEHPDPSHDISHVHRVVRLAKALAREEGADPRVVVPAAYLHDCVVILKTDPRRNQASQISAERAVQLLAEWQYPAEHFEAIAHAIKVHSFSAGFRAETLEAKVVQDADRLDGMGAIGVFRASAFSGMVRRSLYNEEDPFCRDRTPDDRTYALDHFYAKLLKLQSMLTTKSGQQEGLRRQQYMRLFIEELEREFSVTLGQAPPDRDLGSKLFEN